MSVKPVRKPVPKSKKPVGPATPSGHKVIRVDTKTGSVASTVVDKLPSDPVKGHFYTTVKFNKKLNKNVRTTFEASGKKGFGKYTIRRTEHLE